MLVFEHLQLHEPANQSGAQQDDDNPRRDDAAQEHALFVPRVLQGQRTGHGLDPCRNILTDVL